MGMAAILFHGAEPLEQIVNILSTEGPVWNLVKIARELSENKIFKNNAAFFMYIAQGQGQKILIVTKKFCYFNHTLKKVGMRKVQGVSQSQTAAVPRHQEV